MPILTIYLPGQPPEDHSLHEEVVTIGRMTGNAIQLPHGSVSQSHARIMRVGNDFFLKDLKSTNGTLVNGQAIKEIQLGDGDQVKLGDVTAVFRLEGGKPLVLASAVPAQPLAQPSASALEKADTTILSSKAKTSVLRRGTPVVEVHAPVPSPPPKRKSSTLLLLSVLGGVAAAAVVGFLAWKFAGGDEAAVVSTTPMVSRPSPEPHSPITNAHVQPVDAAPAIAPLVTNQAGVDQVVEPTNVVGLSESQRLTELLATLRKPDLKERRHAARAISDLGNGASNVVLNLRLALLQDPDPEVHVWLVAALASNQTFEPTAMSVLIEGLKRDEPALRQRACETLALISYDAAGKATVVPELKTATQDENEEVRKAAVAALKTIAPEEGADK